MTGRPRASLPATVLAVFVAAAACGDRVDVEAATLVEGRDVFPFVVRDGWLYFQERRLLGGRYDLYRIPSGGGDAQLLVRGQYQSKLAVDGRHVYWVDREAHALVRAPTGGGSREVVAAGVRTLGALELHDGHAYAYERDGRLLRVPCGGGDAVTLSDRTVRYGSLAVDDSGVYWTEPKGRGLLRVAHEGGEPQVLYPDADHEIALDEAFVYASVKGFELYRIGKYGGEPEPLAGGGVIARVTVAGGDLFASFNPVIPGRLEAIARIPRTGAFSEFEPVAPSKRIIAHVEFDGRSLYWTDRRRIQAWPVLSPMTTHHAAE